MTITFQKAKKKTRNELQLPILHFVCMDDWIEKLGDKAFTAWLKFYTWCNREEDENGNRPEDDVIPSSLTKVQKRLGVGKDTFYNKILKPLWNHGLIDVFEYKSENWKGQGSVNIIVYEYPQNNYDLAVQPLEQIRNYDTDYTSQAKVFAKLGGRPKKEAPAPRSEIEQGDGSKTEQGVFSNGTGPRSEIEPNNVSNNLSNVSKSNNVSKPSNNLSILEKIENTDLPDTTKVILSRKIERLTNKKLDNIFSLFEIYKAELNEVAFNAVLNRVLDSKVKKSFKGLLEQSIKTEIVGIPKEEQNTNKRKEMIPDWKKELDQENNASSTVEDNRQAIEDFEEQRKHLEEILKEYKRD
ncbi:hypothetical protein COF81_02345 [Bacillus pseudomycoides]|uniref:Replication protein n=1 Tax=Bacillus pseudomycoides TaxID=64104 RepID=A0ABD6TDN7_9BACI|nr:hypothetical protein [Bacillus pseudomycoides]PHF04268.1 hypothetical protein COF81_02345 [Bacillus pseudomycoides]